MRICFFCDLHLPVIKTALQYDVLEWAIKDIRKQNPECIVFAGDVTADGNLQTYEYFLARMQDIGIPFLYIAGNSDLRDGEYKDVIRKNVSPCLTLINGVKFFALNDSERCLSDVELQALEQADSESIVFMHHAPSTLRSPAKEAFLAWYERHEDVKIYHGHEHYFLEKDGCVSLPATDPDKSIGERPCIIYYDTRDKSLERAFFDCALPQDLGGYLGISCYRVEEQIALATKQGLKHLELRPNILSVDERRLQEGLCKWRKQGGTRLSLHLPEVGYSETGAFLQEGYERLVDLGVRLQAERFTQHVPLVSVKTVKENASALTEIAELIARAFARVPSDCIIGVENMHMTKTDEPNETRRFGYTPEETLVFMRALREKCKQRVGVNFDIGHARNNAPYSQKYQISTWFAMLGKDIVAYHLHQVKARGNGFENHTEIDDIYGHLISYASFFRCWQDEKIARAPVILEMRPEHAYETSLRTLGAWRE